MVPASGSCCAKNTMSIVHTRHDLQGLQLESGAAGSIPVCLSKVLRKPNNLLFSQICVLYRAMTHVHHHHGNQEAWAAGHGFLPFDTFPMMNASVASETKCAFPKSQEYHTWSALCIGIGNLEFKSRSQSLSQDTIKR